MDILMTPAHHYVPHVYLTYSLILFRSPAKSGGTFPSFLAGESPYLAGCVPQAKHFAVRNADVPRALVREMYTKSWCAFDRLVAIAPPGGSIGYVRAQPTLMPIS